MTVAARLTALAPLGPVLDALTAVGARYPVHGLAPGLTVDDLDGWTPATALLTNPSDPLDQLLWAAQRRWDAAPHVAAALAWKSYVYWVALPAVLGYATARRVPLLDAAHVAVRYASHQPFLQLGLSCPTVLVLPNDPLAASPPPGVCVVPDNAALLAGLRDSLLDGHLLPLADRIHDRVRVGRRTLLGSLASGVGHALSRLGEALQVSTLDTATDLLSTWDVADLVELTEQPGCGLDVQRRTCCLAFATPQPRICAGCCIR